MELRDEEPDDLAEAEFAGPEAGALPSRLEPDEVFQEAAFYFLNASPARAVPPPPRVPEGDGSGEGLGGGVQRAAHDPGARGEDAAPTGDPRAEALGRRESVDLAPILAAIDAGFEAVRTSLEAAIAALSARVEEQLGQLSPGQYFEAINVSLASLNEAVSLVHRQDFGPAFVEAFERLSHRESSQEPA